jgi:hypothetical protein
MEQKPAASPETEIPNNEHGENAPATNEVDAKRREEMVAQEQAATEQEISAVKEKIEGRKKESESKKDAFAPELCGDFKDQLEKDGTISLKPEQKKAADKAVERFGAETRFSPPSLAIGQKVATNYDSRTRSFATRSRIETLPDGKKVFIAKNYPSAVIHRLADAFGNWLSGSKMAKAIMNKEWKRRYEEKSRVPTIASDDPRTVITPFLENVNAADYFSFNREMKNLGALPELKNDGLKEKTEMAGRIVDELGKIHAEGLAWGEFIPDNVIITKGGKPIITESEVAYYKGVPLVEQQAHDMRDFIISAAGDLGKGEKFTDYAGFAKTLIDRHPDPEVRKEIIRLAKEKPVWWRKALRIVHELPRLGVGGKEYDKIIAAIAAVEV